MFPHIALNIFTHLTSLFRLVFPDLLNTLTLILLFSECRRVVVLNNVHCNTASVVNCVWYTGTETEILVMYAQI